MVRSGLLDVTRLKNIILCMGVSLALYGGEGICPKAVAQSTSSAAPPTADSGPALRLQRSVAIYNYKTTAEKGPLRGEEIYYYKCWICHNTYTIKAGTSTVPLKDLFKRPRLTTGQPMNEQTVTEKIKNGSPTMPAFRHSLSDEDIADLLSYLRDEECCFEGHEPPRNPSYRY